MPASFKGARVCSTSIYFLLRDDEVSHFHTIASDELWYFHAGSGLSIQMISPEGDLTTIQLGSDLENGQQLQAMVPAGDIFGAHLSSPKGYALVGCNVAPGFEFEDFKLFSQMELLAKYPQHDSIIRRLSK